MTRPALFPKPEPDMPRLSTQFTNQRCRPGDSVKWTRTTPRARADCDECTALQHETRGAFWPRRQVRMRRTLNGAAVLRLCGSHTQAWKDRDSADHDTARGTAHGGTSA